MTKKEVGQKNTPTFSGSAAGRPPGRLGPISTENSCKPFVSLAFPPILHQNGSRPVGPERPGAKNTHHFSMEVVQKTLAPFRPECFCA